MIPSRVGLAMLFVGLAATCGAEVVKYSDLLGGEKKLSYGKTIVLTGKLGELKCGSVKLPEVIAATAIQASYLGQRTTPGTGTIEGDDWSAPLGVLQPGVSIQLKLKVTGAISTDRSGSIAASLIESAQFQRELAHFFNVTVGKGTAVLDEEARRLLRNLSDPEGALTGILRQQVPCAASAEAGKVVAPGLQREFAAFANLNSTLQDLIGRNLDAMKGITNPAAAYEVVTGPLGTAAGYTRGGKILTEGGLKAAQTSSQLFKEAYEKTRKAVAQIVVAELVQAVEMDAMVDTSDLEKYAGFDVGAVYVPRIDELRQFFTLNVYPFGPVELSAAGLLKGGIRSRLSLTFGMSMGDISSRQDSRISNQNVFVYGLGYRLNKYFRVSAGAAVYRETSPRSGLLHEFFVGPSIDITALPGLRQIFARAAPE